MIPNHVLNNLTPATRVAVLSRDGRLHFVVHPAAAEPAEVRAAAARDGSEVLATHMHDEAEILALVAERERDLGGEG